MENPIKMDDLGSKKPYFWKHPWRSRTSFNLPQWLICSSTRLSHQRFILERADPKGASWQLMSFLESDIVIPRCWNLQMSPNLSTLHVQFFKSIHHLPNSFHAIFLISHIFCWYLHLSSPLFAAKKVVKPYPRLRRQACHGFGGLGTTEILISKGSDAGQHVRHVTTTTSWDKAWRQSYRNLPGFLGGKKNGRVS